MISSRRVTVTDTATKLVGSIRGAATVKLSADGFVGGDDLTTSNGFPLAAGDVYSLDVASSDALYAIVSSGTATAYVVTNKGV